MKSIIEEIELICKNALSDPASDGYSDSEFEDILALIEKLKGGVNA